MSTLFFEDAVTAANLPSNQAHAVYYVDGLFQNHLAVARQCPHAHLYGITVHGLTGPEIVACDCEKGDLTPAQAVEWVAAQVRLNVPLIIVYANLSTWQTDLLAPLAKYGRRIKRWVAHFDNVPQVPAGFDAKQYATGAVDRNIALQDFFTPFAPKPDLPRGHAHFQGTVDVATGKILGVHGMPGVGVHFTGPEKWLDVNLQLQVGQGGGHWRARP